MRISTGIHGTCPENRIVPNRSFFSSVERRIMDELDQAHLQSLGEEQSDMTLGTRSQPHGKLLDYEQFIDHQLNRTRARIKFIDIMTACLILLAGFLGVLFLEVVLDHVVGLPLLLRRIVLAGGLATAAAFSRLQDRHAALATGQRHLRGQDDRRRRSGIQE